MAFVQDQDLQPGLLRAFVVNEDPKVRVIPEMLSQHEAWKLAPPKHVFGSSRFEAQQKPGAWREASFLKENNKLYLGARHAFEGAQEELFLGSKVRI